MVNVIGENALKDIDLLFWNYKSYFNYFINAIVNCEFPE